MPGDDHVAAAEQTPLAAERKVDIERERPISRGVGLGEVLLVEPGLDRLELDRGGITGVPRSRTIVLRDELTNRSTIRGSPFRHGSLSATRAARDATNRG
jgi:hypothetical protein